VNPGNPHAAELPGGDQDVIACLTPELKARLKDASRVVLVANNPAIRAIDLAALNLGSRDVVISFNTCIKADLLSPQCTHVLVHGFNGTDRFFFGLPLAPRLLERYQTAPSRFFTVLVGCVGPMSPVPGVSLFRERIPLPPLWDYPVDRPGGKRYVGPSTGFNALVLFDALRAQPHYRYSMITVGFSNEAGKLWGGHAWDYERAWLLAADILRVQLPSPRRWWQWWKPR
jgi:hypothetical protein